MSALSYVSDGEIHIVMTLADIEDIRNKLMVLSGQGYHPRYAEPIDQMLASTVAIITEMRGDLGRCDQSEQQ